MKPRIEKLADLPQAVRGVRKTGILACGLLVVGCGHGKLPTPTAPVSPPAVSDPESALYKKLRTADYQVDGAIQELNDAFEQSKKLAPKAGGDAQSALLSVVELLDGAGETLDNYEDAADTLADFKKDFPAQDERRIRSIKFSLDALSKISGAANILDDLSKNVPAAFQKDLKTISDNVDQAQSDLQQAVISMGGQLPEEPPESVDPGDEKVGGK